MQVYGCTIEERAQSQSEPRSLREVGMGTNEPSNRLSPRTYGRRMRAAWDYVKAHPGCFEHIIKIEYGHKVLTRMIETNMIELRANEDSEDPEIGRRCYALDQWLIDLQTLPRPRDTAYHEARKRVYEHPIILSVPCRHVYKKEQCQGAVGIPCNGKDFYGRSRQGPHYERFVLLVDDIIRGFGPQQP